MGVILLAMTIGGLFVAVILLIIALWKRMDWLKKFVVGGVAIWFGFYAIMLFGASLSSEEKTLAPNEAKKFCGFYIDCHMHAAVSNVRKTKTIGDLRAKGDFYVVTVKISSDAKRVSLGLHAPRARAVDAGSRIYERDRDAENALIGTATEPPFDLKVPAGGEFEKDIVFDLPTDAQNPRLDIAEGIGVGKVIESVLIGDEDSIGHKRNYFKLEERLQTGNVKQ